MAQTPPAVRRTKISGLGTYVPPRLLTNQDFEKMVDTTSDWILQRTGIYERHIVDPGVASSDLGKEAGAAAIAQAGLTPADIDRRLLLTIIEKFGGGPVGLGSIAAAISEERDAIEDIYEPFLIQIGFLDRTPRGRVATARAYQHFGLTAPDRNPRLW